MHRASLACASLPRPAANFRKSAASVKLEWRSCLVFLAAGWLSLAGPVAARAGEDQASAARPPVWTPLFDGRSLGDWKPSNFGGEGPVTVADKTILMEFGDSLTGIVYTKPFPQQNYELRLQAMRIDGIDFFCGLTFPVAQSHCSLIVGGWAGAVVGLSCIDGRDASENATTQYMKFEDGRWYAIRVRVTAERIQCWIDDRRAIDQPLAGHRVSTRAEVQPSEPLGIAAWQTKAALRNIEFRHLPKGER
ncbi:MAG: DUF1080 domain-containing protein [Candidatus Anammoximicrobium sp.]|nr:DUF1080 domain-containing protein [Candidatus Anammoximicrobium sp.]